MLWSTEVIRHTRGYTCFDLNSITGEQDRTSMATGRKIWMDRSYWWRTCSFLRYKNELVLLGIEGAASLLLLCAARLRGSSSILGFKGMINTSSTKKHVMMQSSPDARFKPLGDDEKKVTEEPEKEGGVPSIEHPDDPNMPELEDIVYSDDDEDVSAEADMNNLDAFMPSSYKVEKALYGLHHAPRAWYETFSIYLLDNGIQRGKIDKTLFIRRDKGDILLVQGVTVDDIIFWLYGSIMKSLCTEFEKMMHKKFQMSSISELTFFLALQVKQKKDGIFISQDKYVTEILKKFGFTDVKTASTPMETQKLLLKDEDGEEVDVHLYKSMIGTLKGQPKLGLWYPKDSPFDLVAYTDSDYAGASLDRKSTTGVNAGDSKLMLLGINLLLLGKVNAARHKLIYAGDVNDARHKTYYCASIRSDLQLNGEEGMDCLPNATIFEELTKMGAKTTAWNKFSSTMASAIICLATNKKFNFSKYIFESMVKNLDNASKFLMYLRFVQVFLDKQLEGMSSHNRIYVTPSHTKKIFGNMKRVGKSFSGRETPLFPTMVVQNLAEMGEGSAIPTDPYHTPTIIQPSTSQSQGKQRSRRPKRKDTKVPQPSGPTTNVADKVVYEERDDSLERAATTATSLDAEQDRGNIDKTHSKGNTLMNPKLLGTYVQGRYGDDIMFDVSDLAGEEVFVAEQGVPDSKKDDAAQVNTTVTTVSTASTILVSAASITDVEITLAQALAERLVIHEQEQAPTPIVSSQQPSRAKIQDKGKAKMIKPKPVRKLSKKDQLKLDEEVAQSSKKVDAEIAQKSSSKRAGDELEQERDDLETLYKLVKAKYRLTRPVEDLDLVLYGDLKTMFDPHVEDEVWKNQSYYKVLEWKLFDSCGVHSLRKTKFEHLMVLLKAPSQKNSQEINEVFGSILPRTDVQEQDQKENQNQARNGKDKVKVFSMAEIDSKEAQKKLKAEICFRITSHNKHTCFLLSQKKHKLQVQEMKTSAIYKSLLSPVLWAEIREGSLIGPELVLETTDKMVLIKENLKAERERQKSYADKRRKPLEFEMGDQVLLNVIGLVAYRLRLPEDLGNMHDTFHVSNLKKCLADASLHVPLDEIKVDKTLRFVEEPIEIMDHEINILKHSKISLVKVCWNSKRGPEFTWERTYYMKSKYP
ncbi:putative ribonuclease H-like domain-containing protein [Tanacetum coccineum]